MLVLLFLIVPFIELFVLIRVGGTIGVGPTILVVLVVSVIGAWLVKREGRKAWSRIRMQLQSGQLPANEVIDGGLIMLSGALMITPGFVTDIAAILLLAPPVRAMAREQLKRRYGKRLDLTSAGGVGAFGAGFGSGVNADPFGTDQFRRFEQRHNGDVIDVSSSESTGTNE